MPGARRPLAYLSLRASLAVSCLRQRQMSFVRAVHGRLARSRVSGGKAQLHAPRAFLKDTRDHVGIAQLHASRASLEDTHDHVGIAQLHASRASLKDTRWFSAVQRLHGLPRGIRAALFNISRSTAS